MMLEHTTSTTGHAQSKEAALHVYECHEGAIADGLTHHQCGYSSGNAWLCRCAEAGRALLV
jgi:hypothetical protein